MVQKKPVKFKIVRWFDPVRDDMQKHFGDAVEYYKHAVLDGEQHMTAIGNLQVLLGDTPGLAYFYAQILTDAQQIRRWFETFHEQEKAKKYKWFMVDPEAQKEYGGGLKTTDINNFVKADDQLGTYSDMLREIANCEHLLQNIADGFQQRGMTLSKIVDLRVAGLEEVWINSAEETVNG